MSVIKAIAAGIFIAPWAVGIAALLGTDDARDLTVAPLPTTTTTPVPANWTPAPKEDGKGFDCRKQGNRICGPGGSAYPAGCYRYGVLVIAWSNYTDPKLDPLWAQVESPC